MKNNYNLVLLFIILTIFIILYLLLFFNYKNENFYGVSYPKPKVSNSRSSPYVGSKLYGASSLQARWSRW